MIIPPTWSLPDAIRVRLGQNTYGRQRAIVEGGHVLLVLHKPPGPDDRDREGVLFWRGLNGEWQFSRGGPGPGSLKRHVQAFLDREGELAQAYDTADTADALFTLLEALVPLTRAARTMHAALQTAREAIKSDPFLIELRDLAAQAERNFELLQEDVRNALHHRTAREAEAQAQASRDALHASHRLNILAALFFPLTAISSLFGMNLRHGLDESSSPLFWLVFAAGVTLGFILKAWVLAKPGSRPAAPARPAQT